MANGAVVLRLAASPTNGLISAFCNSLHMFSFKSDICSGDRVSARAIRGMTFVKWDNR